MSKKIHILLFYFVTNIPLFILFEDIGYKKPIRKIVITTGKLIVQSQTPFIVPQNLVFCSVTITDTEQSLCSKEIGDKFISDNLDEASREILNIKFYCIWYTLNH